MWLEVKCYVWVFNSSLVSPSEFSWLYKRLKELFSNDGSPSSVESQMLVIEKELKVIFPPLILYLERTRGRLSDWLEIVHPINMNSWWFPRCVTCAVVEVSGLSFNVLVSPPSNCLQFLEREPKFCILF